MRKNDPIDEQDWDGLIFGLIKTIGYQMRFGWYLVKLLRVNHES